MMMISKVFCCPATEHENIYFYVLLLYYYIMLRLSFFLSFSLFGPVYMGCGVVVLMKN